MAPGTVIDLLIILAKMHDLEEWIWSETDF